MKTCLFALLVLFLSLTACQAGAGEAKTEPEQPTRSEKELCLASGGQWTMFNNGCLDACEYRRGEVTICTQELRIGCYCKGIRCWNGSRCEDI